MNWICNFVWNYSLGGILKYNFLINPFGSDTCQSYNTGHSYKINTHYNTEADEYVAWE